MKRHDDTLSVKPGDPAPEDHFTVRQMMAPFREQLLAAGVSPAAADEIIQDAADEWHAYYLANVAPAAQ